MCAGILVSLIASLAELPHYYQAATLLHTAEKLSEQHEDKSAVEAYNNALKIVPTSKRARVGLAVSYFRSPDKQDRKKAMAVLQGLTLDKHEWERLSAVMPPAYQRLFTDAKK